MAPILGYWKIRGLAQPIRALLEYAGEGYDEKYYTEWDSWASVKFTLDLPLPNLPYYIDGDVKVTQSHAIMRHLGRKYDLYGKNEKEKIMVDVLLDQGKDMHMAFTRLCYRDYNPETKKTYLDNLSKSLKLLSDTLGQKSWFVNDKITVADFVLYEVLYINCALDSTCLDSFQSLKNYMKNFEGLPAIRKWMASSRYIRKEINSDEAKFHSIE